MGNLMVYPCGCLVFPRNIFTSLYALVCSVKTLIRCFFFLHVFSVKLLAVTQGCHMCLVKGSYDKWQQLYTLISL